MIIPEDEETLKATIKYLIETNQRLEHEIIDLKSELFRKDLLLKDFSELVDDILKD